MKNVQFVARQVEMVQTRKESWSRHALVRLFACILWEYVEDIISPEEEAP